MEAVPHEIGPCRLPSHFSGGGHFVRGAIRIFSEEFFASTRRLTAAGRRRIKIRRGRAVSQKQRSNCGKEPLKTTSRQQRLPSVGRRLLKSRLSITPQDAQLSINFLCEWAHSLR